MIAEFGKQVHLQDLIQIRVIKQVLVDAITSKSRDKLKKLYLVYQGAYGHQTWQDGNLPWWTPAHKVTWLFDHVILRDNVTK